MEHVRSLTTLPHLYKLRRRNTLFVNCRSQEPVVLLLREQRFEFHITLVCNFGCIGLLMICQDSRFRSGTPQRVLTTQVLRCQYSSTRTNCVPRTSPSWKWDLFNSTRWLAEDVVCVARQWKSFRVWVTVRLYSPWKTTMTSGQDVSDFLDTLGLVKSYFFEVFWGKKNCKEIDKKNVLVLRRPRGWVDFPVYRISG